MVKLPDNWLESQVIFQRDNKISVSKCKTFYQQMQNLDLKGEYNDPNRQECVIDKWDLVFKMWLLSFPFYCKILR